MLMSVILHNVCIVMTKLTIVIISIVKLNRQFVLIKFDQNKTPLHCDGLNCN